MAAPQQLAAVAEADIVSTAVIMAAALFYGMSLVTRKTWWQPEVAAVLDGHVAAARQDGEA